MSAILLMNNTHAPPPSPSPSQYMVVNCALEQLQLGGVCWDTTYAFMHMCSLCTLTNIYTIYSASCSYIWSSRFVFFFLGRNKLTEETSSLVARSCQTVSRWVHRGEWKWNHVPGALSFTMSLPQRRLLLAAPLQFPQLPFCSVTVAVAVAIFVVFVVVCVCVSVRLMSNFNLAWPGQGGGDKQCKASLHALTLSHMCEFTSSV